ncbi:TonB-dependent receptor [Spirosoma humi]
MAPGQEKPQRTISGTVTDAETGEGLPGVTIVLKGTATGTTTDGNGTFRFSVPDSNPTGTLVFSFIGYVSQEVPISNKTTLAVKLSKDMKELQEVVVSYGVQKQREVTGSIAQLNAVELQDMPVGQFAQKLQGKFAGVQINQTTGQPGQGMNFRIRGAASLNAGNSPLIVVDGQPITGNINNINPDEIENFTVLKDASATSLYGSRAANGVILITTKQAKAGETRIDVNAYYGVQSVPERGRPPMMNGREFATYMNEFFADKIKYENWKDPSTGLAEIPAEYRNPAQYGDETNWLNVLLRTAPIQNYSLGLSSAGEKYSSSVVAGYFNQQGVVVNTGYQRYSFRANNEFRPNKRLRLGFNVAPSLQMNHNVQTNTDGQRNVLEGSMLFSPLQKPINPDGSLPTSIKGYNMFGSPNWYRRLLEMQDDYKTIRLLANAYVEVDLLKNLKFKTRGDVDMGGETRNYFMPSTSAGGFNSPPPNRATGIYSTSNYYSWLNENTLNYHTTLNNNHSIDALVGYTAQRYRTESNSSTGTDFPDDAISWISAAATTTGTSSTQAWSLLSMLGRVNYNFREKYMLSAAIRQDGSSRFGEDRRWGVFPSVSVGWVVSDEPFFKNISAINYLKLRSSYGVTGNNNIGNYTSISLIGQANYIFGNTLASGKAPASLGNGLLSWEKNKQFDLGVDLTLLNGRVSLTYDYYNKLTDGLLYQINIPQASGFSVIFSNIGAIKFWGHEFTLSSRNLTGALKWDMDANISFNRNLVQKLGTTDTPIGPANEYNDPWRTAVGQPLGQFYGYVYDGVFMNQGELDAGPKHTTSAIGTVRMKDLNGDGLIDATNDRTFLGDPNPKFLIGMTHNFTYKNFDLNFVFSGAVGGKIRDGMAESALNLDGVFNVYRDVANRWRSPENPGNGVIPRTSVGTTLFRTVNSYLIHDGSFLTAKNIALGYTFKLPRTNYLKRLSLYASVQQAFILTNYKGMNPEVNSNALDGARLGNDNTAYPVPRTVSFGISAGF